MTTTEIKNKIAELEAQVIKVQDTKFGTIEGRDQINALNGKIGELERELKYILEEGFYFELCHNLELEMFKDSWTYDRVSSLAGVSSWIKRNGFKLCKKSEATHLLTIGEKAFAGQAWIAGKHKNYWLSKI